MADAQIRVFATLSDLETRTGVSYEEESDQKRAEALLEDASVALVAFGFDPDEQDAYRLRLAMQCVCNAVSYKLNRDAAYEAATQVSESVGPFSATVSYMTPSGSLTFLRQDLKLLGLTSQRYHGVAATCADLGRKRHESTF